MNGGQIIFIYRSSCMTYHWICIKSNTMGVTCGAEPAYSAAESEFTPGFQLCSCCSIFSFLCNVLQIVVCHFVFCLFAIVFSVRIFTASAIFSFLCNVLQIIVCHFVFCLFTIVFSVLIFTASEIFCFLCNVLQIVVCHFVFCLFAIVFSVLIFTASEIFSFLCNVLQIVVCHFVFLSFCHCVFCPDIYSF